MRHVGEYEGLPSFKQDPDGFLPLGGARMMQQGPAGGRQQKDGWRKGKHRGGSIRRRNGPYGGTYVLPKGMISGGSVGPGAGHSGELRVKPSIEPGPCCCQSSQSAELQEQPDLC